MEIHVPSQSVEVLAECDVLVCGGGCSGVAAAVSAARHGASVILIERWPSVGGMGTNALVTGWHRSDRQKMVILGLVEESAQRALPHGWIWQVPSYPRQHETHWYDSEGMRIVWQRMLDEAGVRTLCYLVAGEPIVEGDRVRGVLCDTKRGRRAILGRIVIDATGDGDIAAKAGVPWEFGRASDGRVQGMTMMFNLRGTDQSDAARQARREQVQEIVAEMERLRQAGQMPPFNLANTRGMINGWGAPNSTPWNMCPVAGDPLDEEQLSRLDARSREQIVAYLDFWRARVPGMAEAKLEQTGHALGVRESRRVKGLKTLSAEMVLGAVKQPDAVGHGVWMIDIHDPLGSGYTTYSDRGSRNMLAEGTSYHIPLGMGLVEPFGNLGVVGRCASSTHEGHSSFRVQTHCMVLAQGIGTAAAMALAGDGDLRNVDVPRLQQALRDDGVYLQDVPAGEKQGGAPTAAEGASP